MTSSISRKDLYTVVAAAEAQGCVIIPRTAGVTIRLPDGVHTIGVHFTLSDWRGWRNTRAEFRRYGLAWPFDGELSPRETRRKRRGTSETASERGTVEPPRPTGRSIRQTER